MLIKKLGRITEAVALNLCCFYCSIDKYDELPVFNEILLPKENNNIYSSIQMCLFIIPAY